MSRPTSQYEEGLRKHTARVTCVRKFDELDEAERILFKAGDDSTHVVEMHETIFYAQGGGQPFDTGYIDGMQQGQKDTRFDVEAVRNGSDGRILHFGHFTDIDNSAFAVGDTVQQHVDGARRDFNSRLHTAGHIIGLAVLRLASQTPELAGVVDGPKAQHYPDAAYVEFKGLIDGKFKDAIQSQATQFVTDALPVNLYWCQPEELDENGVITIEGMPVLSGLDGKVRVVEIVGAGAYPCGGTHVPDTSYVGGIVVRNTKRQKGLSKVSYGIVDKT